MFPFFHHINSLKINPEMLKYLNEYQRASLKGSTPCRALCPEPHFPQGFPPEKVWIAVSLVSFLAGLCFREIF